MPDNNSDNQAKIDREGSVWEVQRAELERLLGEEGRPPRPSSSPPHPPPYVWVCDAIAYIEHLEQAQTDALSVLENMEEGEASILDRVATCPICNPAPWPLEPPAEEPELVGYIHGHPIHKAREEPERRLTEVKPIDGVPRSTKGLLEPEKEGE